MQTFIMETITKPYNSLKKLTRKITIYNTQKIVPTLPILQTSAKSVQTTRVVSSNFSCNLYRLHLKSPLFFLKYLSLEHTPPIFLSN